MNPVVEVTELSRRYRSVTALDRVSFTLPGNTITGLLGRNGAGKTTVMKILTGQDFPSAGEVRVFGERPAENDRVLRRISFVKESQVYPDMSVKKVITAASWFYPNWDSEFADRLVAEFELPTDRRVKKLSRGMHSAVGIVIGLASRAELTLFDEPYLGLDAVARQIFYDRLLADFAENPRTVVLSTHLIDEVANLLEHVVVMNRGKVMLDLDADDARVAAVTVTGPTESVEAFLAGRPVIGRKEIGRLAAVTVGATSAEQRRAEEFGLQTSPVSLQDYIIRATTQGDVTRRADVRGGARGVDGPEAGTDRKGLSA